MAFVDGDAPFIMKPDGNGWLFAPGGMKDGPLPTHCEPVESPVPNNPFEGMMIAEPPPPRAKGRTSP